MSYRILDQQRVTPLLLAAASKVWQIDDPAGAPAYVDETTDFNDAGAGDCNPWPSPEAVGDQTAIVYNPGGTPRKFRRLRLKLGTAGVGGTMAVKYWNGTAWTEVAGLVDGTTGLTAGTSTYEITFDMPDDWETSVINGVTGYWLVLEVASDYDPQPVIDQGWIVTGAPITLPAKDTRAGLPAQLSFECYNTGADVAYFNKPGHDDVGAGRIPIAAEGGGYFVGGVVWLDTPYELYSEATAPSDVLVTAWAEGG